MTPKGMDDAADMYRRVKKMSLRPTLGRPEITGLKAESSQSNRAVTFLVSIDSKLVIIIVEHRATQHSKQP